MSDHLPSGQCPATFDPEAGCSCWPETEEVASARALLADYEEAGFAKTPVGRLLLAALRTRIDVLAPSPETIERVGLAALGATAMDAPLVSTAEIPAARKSRSERMARAASRFAVWVPRHCHRQRRVRCYHSALQLRSAPAGREQWLI